MPIAVQFWEEMVRVELEVSLAVTHSLILGMNWPGIEMFVGPAVAREGETSITFCCYSGCSTVKG